MVDTQETDNDIEPIQDPPIDPQTPPQTEPSPASEIAYLHLTAQGFWQVGFIYIDYVSLQGDQLTFLGSDKRHDIGDRTITIRDYRLLSGNYDPHKIAEQLFATIL